jgi:NADH-quinone oxidoreductase subunit E
MELGKVDTIIEKYAADPSSLLAIMQDVQDVAHYLPREVVDHVAKRLSIPMARVYAMATFFGSFHLEPRGKHICTVCMGTACHVRGAARLVEQLERDLSIKSGGTTKDMMFTVEEVNCVGACALGPLVILDGGYHGGMTSGALTKIVEKLKSEEGGE